MNNFAELDRFFNAFSPEVEGRSSETTSVEMESRLGLLQAGKLSEDEIRELSLELLSSPKALDQLANLLRD